MAAETVFSGSETDKNSLQCLFFLKRDWHTHIETSDIIGSIDFSNKNRVKTNDHYYYKVHSLWIYLKSYHE